MNISMISYILGQIVRIESAFFLLPILVGLIYKEDTLLPYIIVAVICFALGSLLTRRRPASSSLYTHEAFVTVSLSWIIMSIFGAMPFVLTGEIPFFIDALFETVSGFTTTGSSILTDVEALSHTSLFWRSFTHWIGGMGVFVFIMAILPLMGGSTMYLMKAESPGPSVNKLVPHVQDTAMILYGIYLAITIIQIVLLCIFDMPLFDSLCLTFGTVGTGGFGIKNDSIASYTPMQQSIITIFMILSGINYSFYFLLLTKKIKDAFRIEEVRAYLLIVFASAVAIIANTRHMFDTLEEATRHAFFQVGSIITTTGYGTTDFDLWPTFSKCILVALMIVGACAGSTGGGFKVSRLIILLKTIKKELSLVIHPREVRKIRMDGHVVDHAVLRNANVYLVVYFIILIFSTLLVSIDGQSFTTTFTAVCAAFNNIGPGLDQVGPVMNFALFSPFAKLVLIFDMLAGRLEIFPMLVLFMPDTWRRK